MKHMFEKLKQLIFDESVELEPQEEEDFFAPSESLENNKNLIKTQPLTKPVVREEEVVEIEEEQPQNDFVFKRIDLEPVREEEQKPEVKEAVIAPKVKQEPKVEHRPKPKAKVAPKNPQYYKPRAVISPMFGVSQADNERATQIKSLTQPEKPSKDDKIISPMYGVVTAEQEIVTTQSKPQTRRRKAPSLNMSLEEMLNMQSFDELEFTLFDVKVDRKEFESRENKIIDDQQD